MKLGPIGLFAFVLIAAFGLQAAPAAAPGAIRVVARPVPLNSEAPRANRVGEFVYAGGLALTAPGVNPFGGFSDLKVDRAGNLVSETDDGWLLRARILLGPDGRLVGLGDTRLTPLTGRKGKPLPDKVEADAEGVAVWPNGDLMVSFERDHRIWIYPHGDGKPHAVPMPNESMPANSGMEGLALAPSRSPDAYWVGVENGDIFLCRLAKGCEQLANQPYPPLGWRLPALAETPSGELVIAHSAWDPFQGNRFTVSIMPRVLTRGARPIASFTLAPPMSVDNFEGVAVVPGPKGGYRFYLISDDNFRKLQRTLLMAFDWTPPAGRRGP